MWIRIRNVAVSRTSHRHTLNLRSQRTRAAALTTVTALWNMQWHLVGCWLVMAQETDLFASR
jgi:hypothetical protein